MRFPMEAVPGWERQRDLPAAEATHAAAITDVPSAAVTGGTQRMRQRCRLGRAYRAGRLICGWVQVTFSSDERLGLTEQERRLVRVRFHEPIDDGLRSDLTVLLRRRGASAARAAERLDPIEIVVDDSHGERERIRGRIAPPQAHHGPLRDIEFALRTLESTR